jgi:hypothetical protein
MDTDLPDHPIVPSISPAERRSMRDLWRQHYGESTTLFHILIIVSFLATFAITRTITYGIREGWMPVGNASSDGMHIHHYVWGIGLLLIVGYVQIILRPARRGRAISAVLFGIAEALILDEFALLLNLQDVYWQSKGEQSVIAVAIGGSILLLIFFLRTFVLSAFREHRKR